MNCQHGSSNPSLSSIQFLIALLYNTVARMETPKARTDLFLSCFNMNMNTYTGCFLPQGTPDTIEANFAGVPLAVNQNNSAL